MTVADADKGGPLRRAAELLELPDDGYRSELAAGVLERDSAAGARALQPRIDGPAELSA
ncbi:MAG: hypothetical protein ACRD0F_01780 [Acidimicrobiales bacterium]